MGYVMFVRSPDDLIQEAEAEFLEVRGIGEMQINMRGWEALKAELGKVGVEPAPAPPGTVRLPDGWPDPSVAVLSHEQCARAAAGLRELAQSGELEGAESRSKRPLPEPIARSVAALAPPENVAVAKSSDFEWAEFVRLFAGLCDNAVRHGDGDGLVLSQ